MPSRSLSTLVLSLVFLLLAASCGGGGGGPEPDLDTGDSGKDPGMKPDILVPLDASNPGLDIPESDTAADLPDAEDPGPDAGETASDIGDPWQDINDAAEIIECENHQDCEGQVGPLGACEFPECSEGTCRKGILPDDSLCDDGEPCTESDHCLLGVCTGSPMQCDDNKFCTVDSCLPGTGCQFESITGPCNDEDACTENEQCVDGNCMGTMVGCDDGNPCTIDTCDAIEGCQYEDILSGDCNDASVCTNEDQCIEGACTGSLIDCNDSNICTDDTCDPLDGCQYQAVPGKCDDGLDCTDSDECENTVCGGSPVDCGDGDDCTDDFCEEGEGCVNSFNEAFCNDLNPCTTDDTCDQGVCAGQAVVCDQPPDNACLDEWTAVSYAAVGICDPLGSCDYLPQELDCTPDNCIDGACPGDPCEGVDCSMPPGPCFSEGTCSEGSCVFPYANDTECNDENPCTQDDACDTGVCSGEPVLCNEPPSDECLDATTLMVHGIEGTCDEDTGLCDYLWEPLPCSNGCIDGVCIETLGLLQAELTPAGFLGLTSVSYEMSCVMPGWYEGGTMGSTVYHMDTGFEP